MTCPRTPILIIVTTLDELLAALAQGQVFYMEPR